MRPDFAVIIISHGRPECSTFDILREIGYTGAMLILLDDGDGTIDAYKARYDGSIRVFHKETNYDTGDNFEGPTGVATYARNACWDLAEQEGLKYFLMMDDDLKSLTIRYDDGGKLRNVPCRGIDAIIEECLAWMDSAPIDCLGFGSAGDYIGGVERFRGNRTKRLIQNAYLLRTSSRFEFSGRYSEDTITPVRESQHGKLFFGFMDVETLFDVWKPGLNSKRKNGGCQQAYIDGNSYLLRFYAVLFAPDCVKIRLHGGGYQNTTQAANAFPKIVSGRFKK